MEDKSKTNLVFASRLYPNSYRTDLGKLTEEWTKLDKINTYVFERVFRRWYACISADAILKDGTICHRPHEPNYYN